jgi:hypothetical protein
VLRDSARDPVRNARITLNAISNGTDYSAGTSANGQFSFADLPGGSYELRVAIADKTWRAERPLTIKDGILLTAGLQLSSPEEARLSIVDEGASTQASGGEHLSSAEVSRLPLNERDFSKLLLLAAGTMTDANGAANFTQQFAVNGQRGVACGNAYCLCSLGGTVIPYFIMKNIGRADPLGGEISESLTAARGIRRRAIGPAKRGAGEGHSSASPACAVLAEHRGHREFE